MRIYGYIVVEGEICLVEMLVLSTRNVLRRRSEGDDGVYLKNIQVLLEQPLSRGAVERLREGEWIYVLLEKP